MTDRTKSALLIVATLVIGMVLGSLVTGAIANRRFDSLAEARGRMSAFFADAIEPESEEQAEAIRKVLDGAAPRFKEIFEATRGEMKRLSDSVMAELDPILTDAQKERLEKRMRFRPRRPPPPGMRGPRGDSADRVRHNRIQDAAPRDTVPMDAAETGS